MCDTQYLLLHIIASKRGVGLNKEEILSGLLQELRRGTIVLCVLTKLKQPMYGYSLVSALTDSGIPVEANTLYPLLRRLETQGLLESCWEMGENKPRKYYKTTALGNEIEQILRKQWRKTVHSMNTLLEEDHHA